MSWSAFASTLKARSDGFSAVLEYCHDLLLHSASETAEDTRQYLISRIGGLHSPHLTFGYFPASYELPQLIQEFGEEFLFSLGLIYRPFISNVAVGKLSNHNLILPYLDEFGYGATLLGRQNTDRKIEGQPKYLHTSSKHGFQKGLHLWGLFQAKEEIWRQNSVILVEGQFDVLSCWNIGLKNVVALSGSNLSAYQLFSVLKYTDNLILLLDSDTAGSNAVEKILEQYKNEANWKVTTLPEGYKDVDKMICSGEQGVNELYTLLSNNGIQTSRFFT